jgi:Tol biopolymer transport system component
VKPEIDPALDAIVLDCLEKDVKERCQSVAEVARDLRRIRRESTRARASRVTAARPAYQASGVREQAPAAPARRAVLPWIVAGVFALVAAVALGLPYVLPAPPPAPKMVSRSLILPPPSNIFDMNWGGNIAVSPDGSTIVFVAADTVGVSRLWVRRVSVMNAQPLPGTDDAKYPFWSSDSRKIGFFARGKLKSVDVLGGPVVTICDATDGRGGAWNQNGVIIFSPGTLEPLFKVPAAGGIPQQITRFDTTHRESSHRWPVFFPDGNHFFYSTLSAVGSASDVDIVRIAALDSSVNKVLFSATSNVAYGNGQLFFVRQGSLVAQAFDAAALACTGDPVPIAEQIIYNSPYAKGSFAVSSNGVLIVQSGENQAQYAAIFDLAGNRVARIGDLNPNAPRFSPDGKKLVYFMVDQQSRNGDIWVHDLERGTSTRLTFSPLLDLGPFWSPRGDSIAFRSNRSGTYDLYIRSADGGGDDRLLVASSRNKSITDWSRDGKYLLYVSGGDPKTKTDLWILPMAGDRVPKPFLATEFNENEGVFSPDGRWIVYVSDESGKNEIYARLADGTGGKFQVTTNGGRRPIWKADPKHFYFSSLDRKLQMATVTAGPTSFSVDSIRVLFDYESRSIVTNAVNDVSDDGKRVVGLVTDAKQTSAPITLILNWDEELKKK